MWWLPCLVESLAVSPARLGAEKGSSDPLYKYRFDVSLCAQVTSACLLLWVSQLYTYVQCEFSSVLVERCMIRPGFVLEQQEGVICNSVINNCVIEIFKCDIYEFVTTNKLKNVKTKNPSLLQECLIQQGLLFLFLEACGSRENLEYTSYYLTWNCTIEFISSYSPFQYIQWLHFSSCRLEISCSFVVSPFYQWCCGPGTICFLLPVDLLLNSFVLQSFEKPVLPVDTASFCTFVAEIQMLLLVLYFRTYECTLLHSGIWIY